MSSEKEKATKFPRKKKRKEGAVVVWRSKKGAYKRKYGRDLRGGSLFHPFFCCCPHRVGILLLAGGVQCLEMTVAEEQKKRTRSRSREEEEKRVESPHKVGNCQVLTAKGKRTITE